LNGDGVNEWWIYPTLPFFANQTIWMELFNRLQDFEFGFLWLIGHIVSS
jgi:hypothetical protein